MLMTVGNPTTLANQAELEKNITSDAGFVDRFVKDQSWSIV